MGCGWSEVGGWVVGVGVWGKGGRERGASQGARHCQPRCCREPHALPRHGWQGMARVWPAVKQVPDSRHSCGL